MENTELEAEYMQNGIAKLLFIIGCLTILIGSIVGILFMVTEGMNGIMFLISAIVSGVFVLGFSEVVHLLHQINKRQEENGD
jgi:hypothetical protein